MSYARDLLAVSLIVLCAPACKPDRGGGTVPCTPGAHIWVGCNQACGLGTCTGDPWIGVCEGETPVLACTDDTRIAENDDSTDLCFSTCPIVQMICPASGSITVTLQSSARGRSTFTCDWRIEERPPAPVSDVDASTGDAS